MVCSQQIGRADFMGRQMNSAAFRAAAAAAVLAGKPAPVRKLPKPVSKPARQPVQEHVDATPERIARASDADGLRYDRIVDATIETHISQVRR